MTNYEYLLRFLKEYNLIHHPIIIIHLKCYDNLKQLQYQQLFNFINKSCTWADTKEGRLFWEKQHYYCIKYFYDIAKNKNNAKKILKRECFYYLNGGLFIDVKYDKIWKEITEFKKEIFD